MIFIQHRVNTMAQLKNLDSNLGCEIDLRSDKSQPGSLYLAHDPWVGGDNFVEWAKLYKSKSMQGPLILNTKEDGLEQRALDVLDETGIDNYFFLDTTLPTLVKWTSKGLKNFAVRYSNMEPLELVSKFQGKAQWLWVDCFENSFPKYSSQLEGFKICLVSPELQGFTVESNSQAKEWKKHAHAVCTKDSSKW